MNTRRHVLLRVLGVLLGLGLVSTGTLPASAAGYLTISGSGSSWAGNALGQWVSDVKTQGVTVNYKAAGSSTGRKEFAQGVAQFAVSEIPYSGDTADPQDNVRPDFSYGMLPAVAGGTSFMYNLPVGGSRYTGLKLSQQALAAIFSGQVNRWNDPLIAADNPDVNLPDQRITVVVRSDGSGATAQFTLWMKRQFPDSYAFLCAKTGCDPNSATSYFPINSTTLPNFTAQNQSSGVTTYTQNTPYTINYDEYSYALQVGFPVAQVKNAAGFYTLPTASAVAVALTQAHINTDQSSQNYLSQDLSAVYPYADPRVYPLSAYSYVIVPKQTTTYFQASQGATLGYFLRHALCDGQQSMGDLGYSPLPMNLVLAAMDQVRQIPGVDADTIAKLDAVKSSVANADGTNPCNNPTFQPGDSPSRNILVDQAPFPDGCDTACQAPWRTVGAGVNAGPGNGGGATATQQTATQKTATQQTATQQTATQTAPTQAAAQACDPDTGACPAAAAVNAVAAGNAKAVPAVVAGHLGWTNAQNLMIIAGVLVLGLVLAPPLVSGLARRRR